jgi:uncharacterized protein with HEPN domain
VKLPEAARLRLQFLCRVVERETRYLQQTTQRLFTDAFTAQAVAQLESDPDRAERVEAFVGRFGRLQDTLGDKLIPAILAALGEHCGAAADNLDRAERLGFVASADEWFAMRGLRNQMVHEYVEDPAVLWDALQAGRRYVPALADTARALVAEAARRGWHPAPTG